MPSKQQEGNFLIQLSIDLRLSLYAFVVEVLYPVNSFLFIAGAMDNRLNVIAVLD
jgi:hypothetical protein